MQYVLPQFTIFAKRFLAAIQKSATDARDDKKYQSRTLLVASLTLGAIVIYAAISGWQLYEMRKANRIANQAIRNAVDAERPWVGISFSTYNWADPKSPTASATVYFSNSGRRPARATLVQFGKGDFVNLPDNPPYQSYTTDVHSIALILPNAAPVSNTEAIPQLTLDRLQTLNRNRQIFFIYASIQYEDVLTHAQHWTHGCIQFLPGFTNAGAGFVNCAMYNEVDPEKASEFSN